MRSSRKRKKDRSRRANWRILSCSRTISSRSRRRRSGTSRWKRRFWAGSWCMEDWSNSPGQNRPSVAASRAAAGFRVQRLHGADEGAHEFSVHLRRDRIRVNSLGGKNVARILGAVDAGRLDFDLLEAGRGQLVAILDIFESAGHAANPEENVFADFGRDFAAGYDVRYGKTAAGLQHAKRLAQNLVFVSGKIDHAVGNDDVNRVVGKRNALDFASQEFHVGEA